MPQEKTGKVWHTLSKTRRRDKTSAYIHIPFCSTHCIYCGFFANPAPKNNMQAYAKALVRELEADRDLDLVQSHPVNAVYLGGGTPTALESNDLRQVLDTVRRCLPLANDCEITVEGRICDLTEEKIQACIKGGANRFSIGVQTFDTGIRTGLGRVADRETATIWP